MNLRGMCGAMHLYSGKIVEVHQLTSFALRLSAMDLFSLLNSIRRVSSWAFTSRHLTSIAAISSTTPTSL